MNSTNISRTPVLTAMLASTLFLGSFGVLGAPSDGDTLCKAEETTFFSCRLARSSKVASLCGHAGPPRPWLQYRMGAPGRQAELLVPKSIDDPEMTSTFFLDGPAATRDRSFWSVGVWFENVDTIYEVQTWQEPMSSTGADTASVIVVWRSTQPQERGKYIHCAGTSSSEKLLTASDVIQGMSPPWHGWRVSPEDWMTWARGRDAKRRLDPPAGTADAPGTGASAAP